MIRAILFLLALAAPAAAQGVAEPRLFGDRALQTFVDSRAAAFFDLLERDSALAELPASAQGLRDNRPAWTRQLDGFGLAVGWDFVGTLEVAPALRRLCYVVRFRRQPLLMQFDFYRAEAAWDLINATWTSGRDMLTQPCVLTRPRTEPAG